MITTKLNNLSVTRFIKQKRPNELIYINDYNSKFPKQFTMFSTNKTLPTPYTIMLCHESYIKNNIPALFISLLLSTQKHIGLGSKMLKFAQLYSQKNGYNGRFYVEANPNFTPNRVPHIFYRKNGMNTGIKEIDNKLDQLIKNNKNGTIKDFDKLFMYYPPIKY